MRLSRGPGRQPAGRTELIQEHIAPGYTTAEPRQHVSEYNTQLPHSHTRGSAALFPTFHLNEASSLLRRFLVQTCDLLVFYRCFKGCMYSNQN